MTEVKRVWYKALEPDELPEGRVKPVTCGLATVCMTHYQGEYAALDNACPHQNGPLGEGSIEKGFLRCPWHGWDYHPLTGKPPGGYAINIGAGFVNETYKLNVTSTRSNLPTTEVEVRIGMLGANSGAY